VPRSLAPTSVGDGAGQGVPVRGESDADRPLGDHLEAVITGDDVDENWQLKDPKSRCGPTWPRSSRSTLSWPK